MNIVTDIEFMRRPCRPTSHWEVKKLGILEKLRESIDAGYHPGVGLAANQIGWQIQCAIYIPSRVYKGGSEFPVLLLNPRITERYRIEAFSPEGCLSLPHKSYSTWRHRTIVFQNEQEDGSLVNREVTGYEAVVVQHEIDHLNGILCCDRVRKPELPGPNEPCPCQSGKKFKRCHRDAR